MKTILHIEDNLANRVLVERVLEAAGYKVVHAADGVTGIRMAIEMKPDLILIDMGLPDIDGQTVATHLKQNPEMGSVPMVVITAWPAATARQIAERYGLEGCILKPIDVRLFPRQVAQYLEHKE